VTPVILSRAKEFCNRVGGEFLDLVAGRQGKRTIVGFGPTIIPPHQSVTCTASPGSWFKGERLICFESVESIPDRMEYFPDRLASIAPDRPRRRRKSTPTRPIVQLVPARERRIPVQQPAAQGLVISQICVGNFAQLLAAGNPLALSIFSADAPDGMIDFDECAPALDISITVLNLTGHNRTFSGALTGTARFARDLRLFS